MRNIGKAKKEDVESILKLYKSQLGEPFCAWDDGYPCEENIADDLSRESLFIMKDGTAIFWQRFQWIRTKMSKISPAGPRNYSRELNCRGLRCDLIFKTEALPAK